jgi:2-polyprenyl-6-methoxyphenol hydroxylase-like FAD-dependent oxidoreductase
VQAQALREWEQQVQEYNDRVEDARRSAERQYELEQQRIRACREIALEYAKNQPKEIYNNLIIW